MKGQYRPGADLDRDFLHPERFNDQRVYCEAPAATDDDILYLGSDDEAYSTSQRPREERQARYEYQAQRYIDGSTMTLLSARLRGPFDKASGWTNPWRSRTFSAKNSRKRKHGGLDSNERRSSKKRRSAENKQDQGIGGGEVSLPSRQSTKAIPERLDVGFEYLDNDTACRVKNWAESIVVEPSNNEDISEIHDEMTRPGAGHSAEPSKAIGESGLDPRTPGISAGSLSPKFIPLLADTPERSQVAAQSARVSAASLPRNLASAMVSNHHQPITSTQSNQVQSTPPEVPDFSPRAIRIYEETRRAAAASNSPLRQVLGEPAAVDTPSCEPGDTSYHTRSDHSFRFRSRASRRKSKKLPEPQAVPEPMPEAQPRRILAVADLLNSEPENMERTSEGDGLKPEPAEESTVARQIETMVAPKSPLAEPLMIQPVEALNGTEDNTVTSEHDTTVNEDTSRQESVWDVDMQIAQEAGKAPSSSTTASSPVGGLAVETQAGSLTPSTRSSERVDLMNLGEFSFERSQSQSFQIDLDKTPRKLLWPKSQRSEKINPTPQLVSTPALTPLKLDFSLSAATARHSVRSSNSQQRERSPPSNVGADATEVLTQASAVLSSRMKEGTLEAVAGPALQLAKKVDVNPAEANLDDANEVNSIPVEEEIATIRQDTSELKASTPQHRVSTPPAEERSTGARESYIGPHSARMDQSPIPRTGTPVQVSGEQPRHSSQRTQSPWAPNPETIAARSLTEQHPTPRSARLSVIANATLDLVEEQSPWARGDSQVAAIVQPQPLRLLSSPAPTVEMEEPDLPTLPKSLSVNTANPQPPSTPTRYNSSLPTPDQTLSIKSLRDFMTPSPVKRRRAPLGPTDSNGRLPSTQVLADAAVSNPWAKSSCLSTKRKKKQKQKGKTKKRVSWADLLDQAQTTPAAAPETSPMGQQSTPSAHHPRAASPPPSALIAPDQLPTEDQKFGKHFALMAAKRRGRSGLGRVSVETPVLKAKRTVQLLPSASQQVCESPAADAMAEAFVRADEELKGLGDVEGDVEMKDGEPEDSDEDEPETQETVDDVTAVLDNLDDFFTTFDIDAELNKMGRERKRKEREREREKEKEKTEREGSVMIPSGLMDVGVWD